MLETYVGNIVIYAQHCCQYRLPVVCILLAHCSPNVVKKKLKI
jgi:hypothetical protein